MQELMTWEFQLAKDKRNIARSSSLGITYFLIACFVFVLTIIKGFRYITSEPAALIFLLPFVVVLFLISFGYRHRGKSGLIQFQLSPQELVISRDNKKKIIPLSQIKWFSLYGENSLSVVPAAETRELESRDTSLGRLPKTVIYLRVRGSMWSVPLYAEEHLHAEVMSWLENHGIQHSSTLFGQRGKYRKYFFKAVVLFMIIFFLFIVFMVFWS